MCWYGDIIICVPDIDHVDNKRYMCCYSIREEFKETRMYKEDDITTHILHRRIEKELITYM